MRRKHDYACNAARVGTVISVDSDLTWIEKVKQSSSAAPSQLLLSHCDIGETGDCGTPKSTEKINNFLAIYGDTMGDSP
jgi:hypothetical protein